MRIETKELQQTEETEEKQIYKIDPREIRPIETENKQPLGDSYDVYDMASSIHLKGFDMSRDFVLANYSAEVISAKLPKFIREQIKTLKIIDIYLNISKERLKEKYNNKEKVNEISKRLRELTESIRNIIMSEIYSMVIMTRGLKGEVIKAVLRHGMTENQRTDYDEDVEKEGMTIKEKLSEKRK